MFESAVRQDMAIQYFQDGSSLCECIDAEIEKFNNYEKELVFLENDIRKKRQYFKGNSFFLIFLFLFLSVSVLLILPTFFLNKYILVLSLPIAITFSLCLKVYYEKLVIKKYETLYQKAIEKFISNLKEITESLLLHRDTYEESLMLIPATTRHPVAMQIMKESLEGDFTHDVDDATSFYQQRCEKIKNYSDGTASDLLKKITTSEDMEKKRLNILLNLEDKIMLYVL